MANTNSREEEQCHETFVTFFNAATEEQVTFFIEVSKRGNNEVWGIDVCFPYHYQDLSPSATRPLRRNARSASEAKPSLSP